MKVIILAAGASRRLGLNQPKSLIKISGKNLLEIQLNQLLKAGIKSEDINIVTGFKFQDFEYLKVKQILNNEYKNSHQIKSIFSCSSYINFANEDILISYADVLYESSIISRLLNSKFDITVPYLTDWKNIWRQRLNDYMSDVESFMIDKNNFLLEIGKPVLNSEPQGQFMGLSYFKNGSLEKLKKIVIYESNRKSIDLNEIEFTTALNYLLINDVTVKTVPYSGIFNELDFPNDLKKLEKILLENKFLIDFEYLINSKIIE